MFLIRPSSREPSVCLPFDFNNSFVFIYYQYVRTQHPYVGCMDYPESVYIIYIIAEPCSHYGGWNLELQPFIAAASLYDYLLSVRVRVGNDVNDALSLGKYLMNVSSVLFLLSRIDGTRTDDDPLSSLQGIEFTRPYERNDIAIPYSAMFAIPRRQSRSITISVNGKESPHLII